MWIILGVSSAAGVWEATSEGPQIESLRSGDTAGRSHCPTRSIHAPGRLERQRHRALHAVRALDRYKPIDFHNSGRVMRGDWERVYGTGLGCWLSTESFHTGRAIVCTRPGQLVALMQAEHNRFPSCVRPHERTAPAMSLTHATESVVTGSACTARVWAVGYQLRASTPAGPSCAPSLASLKP